MFIRLNKRGQSTLEYAIVIAVIVGGLIAMQVYFKRGVQGKLKQSADDIGSQFSPSSSNITVNTSSNVSSSENVGGGSLTGNTLPSTNTTSNQNQTRNENVTTDTANTEWMP